VVSTILPNLPQAYFTIWGGEAAGIVNPINPMLEPEIMADIMNAAGTKLLVTLAPFIGTDIWQKTASIADQVPTLETILQVDLANYLTTVKKLAVRWMLYRSDRGRPKIETPVYDFGKMARRYSGEKLLSRRQFKPDDIASYFHTSGMTGVPKLAQHTHFNEVFDAWSAANVISMSADDKVFCGLPLFHVNGAILSGLMPWIKGASVVLGSPSGYRSESIVPNFWAIVDYYQINFFSGEPTLFSSLLNVPLGEADISSLEYALCTASPMSVEDFHPFEERTTISILESYGLTEGSGISSVNPLGGEKRVGSAGFRLPYQEMKVVKLDSEGKYLNDCATDEVGMIIIRGPNVFAGYQDKSQIRRVWVDTGDGHGPWFNSGDLGREDAQGYFWLSAQERR
ncbi:MAG: AMP-binding protein, partial [Candidatus Promineifilaceae bacterium]|nr:AMP-binding protein [Candidatus Promineifilaceae bacterium]